MRDEALGHKLLKQCTRKNDSCGAKTVKTAVSASCRGGPLGANSLLIGADLHRAMVATTPGEKLLMGRRPVRSGTRSIRYQAWFFVQKITLVLRKINKNCCHQSCSTF